MLGTMRDTVRETLRGIAIALGALIMAALPARADDTADRAGREGARVWGGVFHSAVAAEGGLALGGERYRVAACHGR